MLEPRSRQGLPVFAIVPGIDPVGDLAGDNLPPAVVTPGEHLATARSPDGQIGRGVVMSTTHVISRHASPDMDRPFSPHLTGSRIRDV